MAKDALERADELAEAKTKECREFAKRLSQSTIDLELANTKANDQEQIIAQLKRELNEANEKIREQTGADLLVNALRELGVVPKPAPKYDAFAEQARLHQLLYKDNRDLGNQRAGQSAQAHRTGLSDVLGGAVR
jgi:small-conductance mechanosensitive channel